MQGVAERREGNLDDRGIALGHERHQYHYELPEARIKSAGIVLKGECYVSSFCQRPHDRPSLVQIF